MAAPPPQAEAAFLGSTSELVHRVEIFQSNGSTRWNDGEEDDRLIDGTVSIDYSRDERRSFDLTLDNTDFGLEHTPDKFWYDKILKIFTGVNYIDTTPTVTQLVRTNINKNPSCKVDTTGYFFTFSSATGNGTRITGSGSPAADTAAWMIWTSNAASTQGGIEYRADTNGELITPGTTKMSFRFWGRVNLDIDMRMRIIFRSGTSNSGTIQDVPKPCINGVWQEYILENVDVPAGADSYRLAFMRPVYEGNWQAGEECTMNGIMVEETATMPNAFDGDTQDFGNRQYNWTGTPGLSTSTETITVYTNTAVSTTWEAQVGEFMIDKISERHFPYVVSVSGRDYTKKCMKSKFVVATAFLDGTPIEVAIKSIAENAGITKFLLPLTGHNLGKDYYFERGVSRWEAMKQIADSFGYELFFDARGYLLMREFMDPVTAPLSYTLATGPLVGNLVEYEKSVNDGRLYNHIVVAGESSDTELLPVWAEALNTEPSSPSRIEAIGDRLYQYVSAFITNETQAQDVADKFLKIHALEEFDLNFSMISLPWLEVGEIVRFNDPRPNAGQPDRFLLSNLNLPLGLGSMSGNGKRVSVVG